MTSWMLRVPAMRVGTTAFGCGLVLVSVALWRAIRTPAPTSTPAAILDGFQVHVPSVVPGYELDRLLASVAKDPFHPERRSPARRFHLPADQSAVAGQLQEQITAGSLRVVGTAVNAGGGGFAMCEWAGGARIVRVGEHVAGWTLVNLTPGAAEFSTPNGRVVVRVPKAGT